MGVGPDEITKGGGHGEGDHEMVNRHKLLETAIEPLGGFLTLAGRTVPVTTGP